MKGMKLWSPWMGRILVVLVEMLFVWLFFCAFGCSCSFCCSFDWSCFFFCNDSSIDVFALFLMVFSMGFLWCCFPGDFLCLALLLFLLEVDFYCTCLKHVQ